MAVASVVLVLSLLAVMAVEFLLVAAVAAVPHVVAVYLSSLAFSSAPMLAFFVGFLAYVCLLWYLYHADRARSNATRSGEENADDRQRRRPTRTAVVDEMRATFEAIRTRFGVFGSILGIAAVVAVFGASLWLGDRFGDVAYYGFLPVFVGLYTVARQFRESVSRELSDDAAVLRTLDDSLYRTDDAASHPELVDLRRRVRRLAQQADVPSPTVELAIERTPLALTVGYRPAASTIVVSRGLLEDLDDRELEAVLAHELAHVANRDAAVMSAMSVPVVEAERLGTTHTNGYIQLVAFTLRGVCRWWLHLVGRSREYVADDGAVSITGDPAGLASALESLDDTLERRPATDLRSHRSAAALSIVPPPWDERSFLDRPRRFVHRRLFGTHPATKKRIRRLRAAPSESATVTAQ